MSRIFMLMIVRLGYVQNESVAAMQGEEGKKKQQG
jgi:hypothetical protein